MKFADIEWGVLRGALIGFGVALAIGALLVGITDYRVHQLAADNSQYQAALNQIRDRYNTAVQERQLIEHFLPQYRQLEKVGFVGEENRLDWIDLLRELAVRHRVLGLGYDVQPRVPVAPSANINVGEFQLQGSEMQLRLSVLHEGNLLGLLQDLSVQNAGVFNLRSCTIERTQREIAISSETANLTAVCTLVWNTIQPGAAPS